MNYEKDLEEEMVKNFFFFIWLFSEYLIRYG